MSIRFDSQACINSLRISLIGAMKELQMELLLESKQRMQTPEGKESLHNEDIADIANIITVSIAGGAWAAMDEYGTGSKMDPLNPALDSYMSGSLWNPVRGDYTIAGRQEGWYTNIFGERVYSSGAYAGRGVESVHPPTSPSHAMETTMLWMKNGRFREKIKDTIKYFPFGNFIIMDKH